MPIDGKFQHLQVQDHPNGGILVRFSSRRLDSRSLIKHVNDELQSLVAPERVMLVDFSNVEFVGSPIIGKLIGIQRQLRQQCGNMTLCAMHPHVEEVFRICNLDRMFDIFPDLETALRRDQSEPL